MPADGSAAQARLRAALADALRRRERVAVSALRSALSAIGNAEAAAADYDRGGQPGPARRLRAEADVLRPLAAGDEDRRA